MKEDDSGLAAYRLPDDFNARSPHKFGLLPRDKQEDISGRRVIVIGRSAPNKIVIKEGWIPGEINGQYALDMLQPIGPGDSGAPVLDYHSFELAGIVLGRGVGENKDILPLAIPIKAYAEFLDK